MPLWFVGVCAVMGVVLVYWLMREVYRESSADRAYRYRTDQYWRLQRSCEEQERERAIFEAIARGRR